MIKQTAKTGHYNVYRLNTAKIVAGDVALLCAEASVFSLNEVHRHHLRKVRRVLRKSGFKASRKGSDMLCWNKKVWAKTGIKQSHRLCDKAPVPFHPARYLLVRPLRFRADDSHHWFNVTHLPQGYAVPGGGGKPDHVARWENEQGMRSVTNLRKILTKQILTNPHAYHHLLGDMNARIANDDEPWYPGVALSYQWDLINAPQNRIDWIVISKRSVERGMKVLRRWTGTKSDGYDSDHKAQFAKVQW